MSLWVLQCHKNYKFTIENIQSVNMIGNNDNVTNFQVVWRKNVYFTDQNIDIFPQISVVSFYNRKVLSLYKVSYCLKDLDKQ